MELFEITCPSCRCNEIARHTLYSTRKHGKRTIFCCKTCGDFFSETAGCFLAWIKKPISLITNVLKARTEGIGLNAVCRVFGIAKNTVLDWERRFSKIKKTLLIYALLHKFIKLQVEGDEVYTRVGKNAPPD